MKAFDRRGLTGQGDALDLQIDGRLVALPVRLLSKVRAAGKKVR
jgi:hypothetical protein